MYIVFATTGFRFLFFQVYYKSCHWLVLNWTQQNAQKVVNLFGGTREKCVGCNKTVYPIEKVIKTHKFCIRKCLPVCVSLIKKLNLRMILCSLRLRLMGHHTTRAASSVPMEVAPLVHRTTLHMKENSTANITTSNYSRRKETTASLRVTARKTPWLRNLRPWKLLLSHSLLPEWNYFFISLARIIYISPSPTIHVIAVSVCPWIFFFFPTTTISSYSITLTSLARWDWMMCHWVIFLSGVSFWK